VREKLARLKTETEQGLQMGGLEQAKRAGLKEKKPRVQQGG